MNNDSNICILSIQLTEFTNRFIIPLKIGSQIHKSKSGYLIEVIDSQNNSFVSELFAFEGFHQKSVQESLAELDFIKTFILNTNLNLTNVDLEKPFFNLFNFEVQLENGPLLYALESLLLEMLLCYRLNFKEITTLENIYKISPDHHNYELKINGLIIPSDFETTYNECVELQEKGINTIKYKLGRIKQTDEINIFNQLQKKLDNQINWRVDGNKFFTHRQFVQYLNNLNLTNIEYFEEPIEDIFLWDVLGEYPLAIDESIEYYLRGDLSSKNIKALIIKPSVVGSISKSLSIIHTCQNSNIKPVISSSFEGPIGMKTLRFLAHYQNQHEAVAAGLDTLRYLV